MKKIILIFTVVIFICKITIAQQIRRLTVSVNPAFIKLIDDKKINAFGGGLGFSYTLPGDNKTFISTKLGFYPSKEFNTSLTFYNTVSGVSTNTDINSKVNFLQFSFGIQRYLIGEYQYDFSVYGTLEYSLLIGSFSYNLKTPDSNLDYGSFIDGSEEKGSGKGIRIGAGCEKKINSCYIFGDLTYNYIFSSSNSTIINNSDKLIPSNINFLIGIKIPIL